MSKKAKLTKIFNKATIKQQLYTVYAVVVVVPVIAVGMFLLINNYRMMVDYHRDLVEADNFHVRNVMFELTTRMYNISKDIYFDSTLRKVLSTSYVSEKDYMEAVNDITLLDNYEQKNTEIKDIYIYIDNPDLTDYKQFVRVTDEIEQKEWYQRAITESGAFWYGMPDEENGYWNLCLIRKITLVDVPYSAVLMIKVNDSYLSMRIDNNEYINMLSVDEGEIFYSSDRSQYGKKQPFDIDYDEPYYRYIGKEVRDGKKCFAKVFSLHTYQTTSKIYICTINEEGYANIEYIQNICILIILLAIIIPGIMIHIFTSYFTNRVNVLRQEMHKASNQDYELISSFQGNDELSEAFDDLQIMVQNIKEQEAMVYEAQINEKELMIQQQDMEFKMLASQINPHFLYNTLETIRMKSFTAGDKEVATAIKLLGKSLRYVLENTGTAFISLEEELKHVETYIMIQRLRFGDRIQYEKKVEEGINLQDYQILPLLLQPVVENAILHGLEDADAGGKIEVSVYLKSIGDKQLLYIDVVDNGFGMDEEVLEKLRKDIEVKDMSRSKSIGLYNTNQRIKLNYGDAYRIHIYSEVKVGTTVRLIFPTEKMK